MNSAGGTGSRTDPGTVTRLLADLERGDSGALDALFPIVYDELRELAHRQRSQWHGDNTLGTTALVHEAYLKFAGGNQVAAHSRVHFLRVASRAMRQIISNYARDRPGEGVATPGGGMLEQRPPPVDARSEGFAEIGNAR